ncbi:TlpA family protein disulfide reductase [Actinocrispum wychmicini]|uniref:Thiol-disulfide isomerase/thioredoxin n=1 Tax=Actinocrispum wychmicini TaxID=1213861 RepID=A0A4R2JV65_9PSEU|nr:TlpA disulfide reductase family protein [Actinocrispum wychmicini]TCO64303.1 thiol-disulfide isomerase/thioredoxin [Actinocrispum wychmicini]
MSTKVRWALVALVLVVASAVAFWPREDAAPQAAPTPVKTGLPSCARAGAGPSSVQGLTATCLADGAPFDVRKAFAGPVLVNVWATWCAPCQDELPVLSRYAAEPGATPVVELAVDSDQSTAIAMLTDLKVNLPSLLDRDGSVRRALKVPDTLPASYLVDSQGNVRFVSQPRVFKSVADVAAAVGR